MYLDILQIEVNAGVRAYGWLDPSLANGSALRRRQAIVQDENESTSTVIFTQICLILTGARQFC